MKDPEERRIFGGEEAMIFSQACIRAHRSGYRPARCSKMFRSKNTIRIKKGVFYALVVLDRPKAAKRLPARLEQVMKEIPLKWRWARGARCRKLPSSDEAL